MTAKALMTLLMATLFISVSWFVQQPGSWLKTKHKGIVIYYQKQDVHQIKHYKKMLIRGHKQVKDFFADPYPASYNVYVHPDRMSLDSAWQKDWAMPTFKSECWMVASGVAHKMDILSPVRWDSLACEHKYQEKKQVQQLIIHELVHVFHGQNNASPDFSNTEGIDWLVEGLAVYASGQLDATRLNAVKDLVNKKQTPATLENFWKGKNKYGLAGSMIMYIDHRYGRTILKELLPFTQKQEILTHLKTSEEDLIAAWGKFLQK
jgi:hypothetical protein